MAFLQVQFFSKSLCVGSSVYVILPEPDQGIGLDGAKTEKAPKVLYLLHGYSDDHTIWMRRTSIERYAAEHNLAVIMPAVNHSFYCNEVHGEKYWDYISEELPSAMASFFKISASRDDTYVAGLSMGGYGAMKLALTHPSRFAAAGCFSGAVDMANYGDFGAEINENNKRVFGDLDRVAGSENDLFYLMQKNSDSKLKPRLYVSCGTGDFLYSQYKKFVPALKENGWDVTSSETEGEIHRWQFWDKEIEKFIKFIYEK